MDELSKVNVNGKEYTLKDEAARQGSGGSIAFIAQDDPPEDTSVLWVNTSYDEISISKPTYYIATNSEYGISTESEDNTAAMQNLINLVHRNGGGIIWLPIGEYRFNSANSVPENADFRAILTPQSGVSIMGESISGTVIKVYGNTEKGASWLANFIADKNDKSVKLFGCTYQNFTIDMSEATVDEYSSTGKALGMKSLKDCVFRDLRLLETPSTALGIDMLDNVVIDSVYIYKGGREWSPGGQGGAGIGIGTGKWDNENYVVRNCICVECGHFGIFLEDQGIFSGNSQQNYPEGPIIANNVIRNGRNYGIGVRGGRNVIVTGNNLYGNKGGVYLDYGAKNALISNNVIADSTEAGVMFGIEDQGHGDYVCENVAVLCNSFFDNKLGVSTALRMPINSEFTSNVFIGNENNLHASIPIDESKIKQGIYINDSGEEAVNARSWLYDEFIDLYTTTLTWTPIGKVADGTYKNPRIAIYDENKGFLHRINGDYDPSRLESILEESLVAAGKSTNYRYIKFGDNCEGEIIGTLRLYILTEVV